MNQPEFIINKGAIFFYRLYDVAHEINLKKALEILDSAPNKDAKRFSLKNQSLSKGIVFRDRPLVVFVPETSFSMKVNGLEIFLTLQPTIKIWDYGVFSLGYR